jgi:6-phosphofructokinase
MLNDFQEIRRCGLKVVVVGIPKTIDNDCGTIEPSNFISTPEHCELEVLKLVAG